MRSYFYKNSKNRSIFDFNLSHFKHYHIISSGLQNVSSFLTFYVVEIDFIQEPLEKSVLFDICINIYNNIPIKMSTLYLLH